MKKLSLLLLLLVGCSASRTKSYYVVNDSVFETDECETLLVNSKQGKCITVLDEDI